MKFKQNLFVGEPNPNILCIGGCDLNVLETLDINLSSVRRNNITLRNNNQAQTIPNNRNNNQAQTTTNNNNNRNNNQAQTVSNNNRNNNINNAHDPIVPRRDSLPLNNSFNATAGPSISNTSINNDIVCACNLEPVQLTVRKEGPNKGRKFYKCKNSTCDFFLWASDEPNNTTVNNVQNDAVQCNCNVPATRRTVSKEGPNKGRPFYCCAKPMAQSCGFFKWADEVGTIIIFLKHIYCIFILG